MIYTVFLRWRLVAIKTGLFGFLLLFCSSNSFAQKSWTLQECITYALDNNISIKQSEISRDISAINYTQSKASFLPSLNGSSSYSYNFGRSVDPYTYNFTNQEIQSGNYSLSANLNLFNGLQLQKSLAQSNYEFLASNENLSKIKNDIALNVAAAYLQVLYSKESLKAANERLESAQQTRSRTKIMVDAGSMAQGNLLDADAALAAEELAVVNAENQLKSSLISLTQLLEIKSSDGFSVVDPVYDLPEQSSLTMTPDQIFETSMKVLPEFRASQYNIMSAEKSLSVAKGARYPRLSLFGSISSGYSNYTRRITGETVPFKDQIDENFNKVVGLSLSIPLFNGYSTESNIKRSRLNLESVRYNDQQTKNQVYKSIVQAHADASAGLKRLAASEKAAISNAEAYTYAEKKYNVGMLSSIEFLNVRNNKSKAESDFLQAKYDLIFRIKVLDFYLGKPLTF